MTARALADLLTSDLCVNPAGSSCGVSVCLARLRRLTGWWRPLPRDTVTATLGSSRALVHTLTVVTTQRSTSHFSSYGSALSSDTCYVLSFAIIMLNTSLHNPNVRDKPGLDRFISMNRGINEGGDLPEDLLRVRVGVWCVEWGGWIWLMSVCLCFSHVT